MSGSYGAKSHTPRGRIETARPLVCVSSLPQDDSVFSGRPVGWVLTHQNLLKWRHSLVGQDPPYSQEWITSISPRFFQSARAAVGRIALYRLTRSRL